MHLMAQNDATITQAPHKTPNGSSKEDSKKGGNKVLFFQPEFYLK